MMLMLNVPATFGLFALATPIVQLLFERGHFLPADTAQTAAALRFYAIGLVGYSTVRIASPTFYAIHRSRVPVIVSVCSVTLNVVLSITLTRVLGFRGLALGTSAAAIANGALLAWVLRSAIAGLDERRLAIVFAKTVLAASVMTAIAVGVHAGMRGMLTGGHFVSQVISLGLSIGAGLAALAASAKALRISEFEDVVEVVTARLSRKRSGI